MINKIAFQGLVCLVLFFGMYFGLSQVDFVTLFRVQQVRDTTEQQLGDLVWEQIEYAETTVTDDSLRTQLDKLILPICKSNGIDRDSLKIHLVKKDEANAFALPNSHLVIYTGLIADCKKQEALQGVIGHEMAHIRNNHVMKKLSKEIGLSALINATTGGKGSGLARDIFKMLSSSAYDRSLEEEADREAVRYLTEAGINPEPLADFMYELSLKTDMPDGFYWISTHPESEERAKHILKWAKGEKHGNVQTLNAEQWERFREMVRRY